MINLDELVKQLKGAGEDVGPLRYVAEPIAILRW